MRSQPFVVSVFISFFVWVFVSGLRVDELEAPRAPPVSEHFDRCW